jgi:adenine-specific DNA-methyltransferase
MGFRYIGSKMKIVDSVLDTIKTISPFCKTVCDLMSGTGCVSRELRKSGYTVISNDVMTFSYHHSTVFLLFCKEPEFINAESFIRQNCPQDNRLIQRTRYQKVIDSLNNLKPTYGYFFREFSENGTPDAGVPPRKYFTPENAAKIDAIRYAIKNLHATNMISDLEHSLLLHDLIMAVNDIANIAGTYGHFMGKFVNRASIPLRLSVSHLDFFESNGSRVIKGYAEDVAEGIVCDVCYIDPPYMKRQYAANYHILETLAREDEPQAVGISGLRPWRDQYSNFCTKTKISKSLDKIITSLHCKDFVISYSEDGLIPVDTLINLLKNYGNVSVREIKHKRFKSNGSSLAPLLTEYLIHLKK